MKIYFAGVGGYVERLKTFEFCKANKLMLTFAEKKSYSKKQWERFKHYKFEILLDSGAFSVWKKGIKIDILEYCDYVKEHNIENYICLDEVGNFDKSYQNLKIMEKSNLKPIPVFHYGTDLDKLKILVDDSYSYICLGGTVGLKREQKRIFFESIFQKYPNIKFHGLGIGDHHLIKNFPFYSVDSTTWLMAGKYKKIFDENGKRVKIPPLMEIEDRWRNTIGFFVNLENQCNENK